MSSSWPFYFTWTAQEDASPIHVTQVNNFSFQMDDKEVWDLSSVSLQASFGLKNEQITKTIKDQINDMPIASAKTISSIKENTTEHLLDLLNLKRGKIFYTVSGAESIENALKMVRQIKNKEIILARKKSYHGASLGALSVTGDWRNNGHKTIDDWTVRIPEPHEDSDLLKTEKIIQEVGSEKIAAFCLETIPAVNGVNNPSQNWYNGVRRLCDKYNIALILDEVVCGFYRTGAPFAFSKYKDLRPDFVCLGKAISGGFIPFGALWTSDEVANFYQKNILSCGLTNYAHPLGLASLKAVLDICNQEKFQILLSLNIEILKAFLNGISSLKSVSKVRQTGMLAAIELLSPPVWNNFLNEGLHLICRDNMLILGPCLNYDNHKLKSALSKLETVLQG